jgi:hypothetical protein
MLRSPIAPAISAGATPPSDLADDIVEEAPLDYSWIPFPLAFLLMALLLTKATGWRLILSPPLVVIAFEMFAHARICPWARRPLALPIACVLCAVAGVFLVRLSGATPLAAIGSAVFGVGVLRVFELHVPPALAVVLLPFVISNADYEFLLAVGVGTLLLMVSFLAWRRMAGTKIMTSLGR